VPVKVTVCDAAGRSAASAGIVLHATGVDGGPASAPGNSQPGNNFRYTSDSGSYQYNLKTDGLADGTHRFTFTVGGDPTVHSVTIVVG
jgi:hypothetical protein